MPSSREAALRHARHFVDVLEAAAEQYQAGGESVLPGLKSFDAEWANIQSLANWREHPEHAGRPIAIDVASPD